MPKSFLLHISQWNASSKVVSALHFKPQNHQKSSKYVVLSSHRKLVIKNTTYFEVRVRLRFRVEARLLR